MTDVVQRFWGFCHTLRHDGIDYGDYIEQITYLLFLKMADEREIDLSRMPVMDDGAGAVIDCSWPALASVPSKKLTVHYASVLKTLGSQPGLLRDIFQGAVSRFNNPANLKRLIDLIDDTEWTALEVDLKAAVFEGLLEKAASEGKKGAGQYFTPRRLIQSIVRCVQPDPRANEGFTICDPACGTGGFLVVAYEWFLSETREQPADADLLERVRCSTYFGQELVSRPRRLALMNLFLHGLEPEIKLGDSIEEPDTGRFDVVLTNPPFGNKGANQVPRRDDLVVKTSNKQLNFLQHVITLLKPGGRAAVIVPDNCLFADQAGEVFKILTQECDLHTVLRLPNGTFTPYSAGTKTNVVFFTKGTPTETVWVYDARTNVPRITKKDRPLTQSHLSEFESCYGRDPDGRARRSASHPDDRWRSFSIVEVRARDYKLDGLKWLKEESLEDELPEPEELATEAMGELENAMNALSSVLELLATDAEPRRARGEEEVELRRPRVVRGVA